ncbi:uncharacterized protein LOC108628762 [Ceratina calcarata]|uniref:Uncharacterized protein LOC108628762 n=1 Tax=Ceratina calcarata TaxID=156304 RepID=A0AAJ7J727_9HYME|nr:uncharacterized protein LOC108628762 [Ceratina calcarata]
MDCSNINDIDIEDSLTNLNTQLNKSMVLMDTTETEILLPKSKRAIKINTKIQPPSPFNSTPVSRKSILKKDGKRNTTEIQQNVENNMKTLNETDNNNTTSINILSTTRPQNINELVEGENLIIESTDSTFTLEDLSDNEDVWIMDIPRTIDPIELKGQTLTFGEKSKFKVKDEKYCAVNHEVKSNVTCIFNTNSVKSRYKAVNVKPVGTIGVRKKLSSVSKTKSMQIENYSVPFPKNLRTRHPLFGVSYEGKTRKVQ